MELNQAIQKLIDENGVNILKERRFVNMLSDLQAFEQLPYAANMLKQIYQKKGYGTKIYQLYRSQDKTKVTAFLSELRNKFGFGIAMLKTVFDEFGFSITIKQKTGEKIYNTFMNNEYIDECDDVYRFSSSELLHFNYEDENIFTKITKERYIVNSVGDANCICIKRITFIDDFLGEIKSFYPQKMKQFLIDFGYSSKAYFTDNVKQLAYNADEFLLSHYHLDHYKGLENIDNGSLLIEKLYYPYIPIIKNNNEIRNKIHQYMYFNALINCKLNGMGLGLIQLMKQKNLISNFKKEIVYESKKIFDGEYEVIWPPKELYSNNRTTKPLKNAITKIEDVLNSEPEIRNLWNKFNRQYEQHLEIEKFEEEFEKYYKILDGFNINDERYTNFVKSLNKVVRKVTNRFSVCLFKKGEFLFLGDLEKAELKNCLERLSKKNDGKLKIKYLITPHHGTKNHYWSQINNYIEAEYVISSNGENGFEKYAKEYNKLAQKGHFCTVDGTFDSIKL